MTSEARPPACLGIDVGRAATTGLLLAADGRELARATVEHPPLRPRAGLCEQDPEVWWTACREVIARLKAGVEVDLVAAGLAGEAGGLVVLDRAGRPIRRAILGPDRRAEAEARELVQRPGWPALEMRSGRRAGPCLPAAKVLWLAANEPEAAQRVGKILAPRDLVRLRLTGEVATDASEASATGFLDLAARRWSEPLLEALGLAPELLPEVFESAEVAGRVSVAGAAETGLPEGLPVVAGGTALACAALAAGVVADGRGLAWLGPGGGVLARVREPRPAPEDGVEAACDATGGFHLLATLPLAGSPLRWLAETLAPERAAAARAAGLEPEVAMLEEALAAAPGAGGLLFLPALDGRPCGGPGRAGAWLGLGPGHGRRELARALVEGLGQALAGRLGLLRARAALAEPLALAGQAAREEAWRAILAAQLGMSIEPLGNGLDPARGAAILAAVGAGLLADPSPAIVPAGPPVAVDPQLAALYRAAAARAARAAAELAALAD